MTSSGIDKRDLVTRWCSGLERLPRYREVRGSRQTEGESDLSSMFTVWSPARTSLSSGD